MTLSLQQSGVRDHYRSDTDDIAGEFYGPCLATAARYDRAVGYFTGTSLALAASGVDRLARRDGKIRLIASPHLTEEDLDQIELGYEYRKVIEQAILRELGPQVEDSDALLGRLGLLGRLVGENVLDIRIAVVRRANRLALYHEKIGIFSDIEGNKVAFNGSPNETASALLENFESMEVFRSWEPEDRKRVHRIADDFDRLWNGGTPHVEVLEFPSIGKDRLLALARSAQDRGLNESRQLDAGVIIGGAGGAFPRPNFPEKLRLRPYQRDAIKDWFAANGHGMFEMATGTGKTITALAAVTKLAEVYDRQDRPLLAVVVAPQIHLVDQWAREAKEFGIRPLCCYDDAKTWVDNAHALTSGLASRTNGFAMVISTNATLSRPAFQQVLNQYQGPFVIVADEAHNLGAKTSLSALPQSASHRLALSATPERWFDPVGTQGLRDYFGSSLIQLGLRDAIEVHKALCPYDYRPIPVPLEEDESQQYASISQRLAQLIGRGDAPLDGDGDDELSRLLRRRSQLLAHARGKLAALAPEVERRRDTPWQLVYCAEGRAPQSRPGEDERQVDLVLRLLGRDLGIPSHPYTAMESPAERRRILERFREGELRALVSMRCLDEGVDIPDARMAYMLASSTNPRQFIQRRGRILRRSDGKDSAEIVDFIAVPTGEINRDLERRLLRREVERFVEFASSARNAGEALAVMRPLRQQYGLMDV